MTPPVNYLFLVFGAKTRLVVNQIDGKSSKVAEWERAMVAPPQLLS